MSEKKEWWEKLRDISLAITAILAVISVAWTTATKDINNQININSNEIKKLDLNQQNFIKWSDISALNDQLKGMNKKNL